jgi:hypothetical protein
MHTSSAIRFWQEFASLSTMDEVQKTVQVGWTRRPFGYLSTAAILRQAEFYNLLESTPW